VLVGAHEDEGMPVLGRRDAGGTSSSASGTLRAFAAPASGAASSAGSKRSNV
jgi:hypothetical protein